jgi:hypothetical protein
MGPDACSSTISKGMKIKGPAIHSGAGSVTVGYSWRAIRNAEAFVAMFRSGKRAAGSAVRVMPFGSFSKISDADLRALYLYLKSL